MCLAGNEAEIIAALDALKASRERLAEYERDLHRVEAFAMSNEECRAVLASRIIILEQRCRELGCHGPAPKADRGDALRIASAK